MLFSTYLRVPLVFSVLQEMWTQPYINQWLHSSPLQHPNLWRPPISIGLPAHLLSPSTLKQHTYTYWVSNWRQDGTPQLNGSLIEKYIMEDKWKQTEPGEEMGADVLLLWFFIFKIKGLISPPRVIKKPHEQITLLDLWFHQQCPIPQV